MNWAPRRVSRSPNSEYGPWSQVQSVSMATILPVFLLAAMRTLVQKGERLPVYCCCCW